MVEYARGRELAEASRLTSIAGGDLVALEEVARTDARLSWRPSFDPSRDPHDSALVARRAEVDRDLDLLRNAERFLLFDLSEATLKGEAAHTGSREPELPVWLVAAFVGVFAATVAPTLHDNIFHTLSDEILIWFCSALVASLVGVAVVGAMFAAARLVPGQPIGREALAAGVVISCGLAVLRASSARTLEEFALTIGLMAVEIGVLVYADFVATRYREARALSDAREIEAERAARVNGALRQELGRVQARKAESLTARDAVDAQIAERSRPVVDVTDLETLSVKSACHGYRTAIAENLGRMVRTGGATWSAAS